MSGAEDMESNLRGNGGDRNYGELAPNNMEINNGMDVTDQPAMTTFGIEINGITNTSSPTEEASMILPANAALDVEATPSVRSIAQTAASPGDADHGRLLSGRITSSATTVPSNSDPRSVGPAASLYAASINSSSDWPPFNDQPMHRIESSVSSKNRLRFIGKYL